ncbi:PKD domain-containing protein [Natronomonas halophila]|uniref:PKD domain-containing protein n=1 Tax=Natronomonas halophila TaxID=2747817 RepID=UPI0015B486B4|nr:PKD domain-containing protein [Natronomonas halophila]QLD85956.1 PKD domain-containing protein [Natronomonas halophila]
MTTHTRRTRAFAGVAVAVVLLVGCLGLVAIAAPNAAAAEASEPVSTYADTDGTLTVLYENGTTKSLGVSPNVIGPMEDIDGDGTLEVTYIDQSNDLHAIGLDGSTGTLVSNNATGKYIAVGDWNGDGTTAVYYKGSNNGKLWRVEAGGTPEAVRDPSGNKIATNSPLGVADYDGDGNRDIIYLGSSSTVKYYDGETVDSTGFSSFGSNNGLGIGEPATFEDRGVRVPYITGSNNLALLAADSSKEKLDGNYGKAVKAPVAAADWNGDGTHELMHVHKDNNEIYVGYLNGSVDPVTNAGGSTVQTTAGLGILAGAARPAPTISEYNVANPEGRDVRVSFNSSDRLTDIEIDVSGAESATLTEADTTESGSGPYQYVATYRGSVDGDYTATLVRAANSDGVDGASGESGTVTVETPSPTVDIATLTDAADGDGLVTDGDSVRVEATVHNESRISSVTADASAFGAGNVVLAHESGSTYTGTFTVDAAGVGEDGNLSVAVTATNEYGHTDTNGSDTVFVDTTPPDAYAGPNATIEEDTKVIFNGRGTRDNYEVVGYAWDFGDGTTAPGDTVTNVFEEPGTYTVALTAEDAVGQTATDTLTLEVTDVNETTSDTSDSETTTETDVVRIYEERDTETETESDTETETQTQSPSVIELSPTKRRVVNRTADGPVAFAFEADIADTEPVPTQVTVLPERDGPFNISVRPLSDVGPPAPNHTAVAGYFAVNHTIDEANISKATLTLAVPKSEVPDDDRPPTVYRRHNGSWEGHEAARVDETNDTVYYNTRLPGLSTFAMGFRLPALSVERVQLEQDAERAVDVTAVVTNDGTATATESVALQANGDPVATKNVTVPPGENRTVTMRHTFESAGNYRLSLNGDGIGSLTVDDSGATETAATGRTGGPASDWWLFALLFATLLGGGGLVGYRQLNGKGR